MRPTTLQIISRANGSGLDRDVQIVKEALKPLMAAVFTHCRERAWWKRFLPQKPIYRAAIFLERIYPLWYGAAECNFVIPNQERYPARHIGRLKKMKAVLAKTRHAQKIFEAVGAKTEYIGFTSPDRRDEKIEPNYHRYLHVAGRSTEKGTTTILKLWAAHPDWPKLTLIQHPDNAPKTVPANVELLSSVTDAAMREIQNSHGIHLCPSRCEGWGHTIVEGMSCRAVVVTTHAAPMNEMGDSDCVLRVRAGEGTPRNLGWSYPVDAKALEDVIVWLQKLSEADKKAFGNRARAWYEANDADFKTRMVAVVGKLLG